MSNFLNRGLLVENEKPRINNLGPIPRDTPGRRREALEIVARGNAMFELNRLDEAVTEYDQALALAPDCAEAWNNRGNVLNVRRRLAEALECYDEALRFDPTLENAWEGRGDILRKQNHPDLAADAYCRLLKVNPDRAFARGTLLHLKLLACDWDGISNLVAEIRQDIAEGKASAEPFGWLGVSSVPASLKRCAEIYADKHLPLIPSPAHPPATEGKIRIGYLSGHLGDQATWDLLAGVLEQHDRTSFEIYAFDNGRNDCSQMRRRLVRSLVRDRGKIVPIRGLSDAEAAAAVRAHKIDILVNLNGYFGESRTGVFAQRPAPIQVNYLGFPGTLGAPFMDYIVADRTVIPEPEAEFYAEKIAWLPHCYQANDDKKLIGTTGSRAEHGLPDDAFVFCCFNNCFKILPDMFLRWMRILERTPGSVLWLLETNAAAAANLRKQTAAHGIDPARLIFAPYLPLRQHLARHQLADLFLDTLPCNAHTTASDALWAGLALLTSRGTAFSGRVAASLLQTVGLPELIAETSDQYEVMAVELARSPQRLAPLRHKLAANRKTQPLFGTARYTRNLETAYRAMQERRRAGLAADHITVPAGAEL